METLLNDEHEGYNLMSESHTPGYCAPPPREAVSLVQPDVLPEGNTYVGNSTPFYIKESNEPSKKNAYKYIESETTNDKEDIITTQLQQYALALRILSKYPEALRDFCLAVSCRTIST